MNNKNTIDYSNLLNGYPFVLDLVNSIRGILRGKVADFPQLAGQELKALLPNLKGNDLALARRIVQRIGEYIPELAWLVALDAPLSELRKIYELDEVIWVCVKTSLDELNSGKLPRENETVSGGGGGEGCADPMTFSRG